MKKQALLLTALLTLFLSNVFSQSVYITKHGKKYHMESCRYLRQSKIPIELNVAFARGFEACKVCNPPKSVSSNQNNVGNNSQPTIKNENVSNINAQCSATTKAGSRCKRTTKSQNGFCWQHGGK